jgi:hypothetical protein
MHYNGVGWVDKPNVSDGLSACWVFNPTYPLCHFFMHSTIERDSAHTLFSQQQGRLKDKVSDDLDFL